jgi:hypothetical protein
MRLIDYFDRGEVRAQSRRIGKKTPGEPYWAGHERKI